MTSSIVNKYGDRENVPKDCKALFDIIDRQGFDLILDCIAEHFATSVIKFKLDQVEVSRVRDALCASLNEAINERT